MSAIVHTAGLVKRYDRTLAVAGLDLDVEEGEIFGLVGPNGAGKTTTMRILATLLVPDAGDAEIAGFSLRRHPNDVRRVLGFMPDSFGVYDDMKVWEYLDFFARCYGIPADRRRADDRRPARPRGPRPQARHATCRASRAACSSGCASRTRSCTTRACCSSTSRRPASTPAPASSCASCLRELRTLGKTILVSSHILPELEELCTSVAIIDRGQVLAQGRVADIERRLRVGAVYRVRIIGDDEANVAAQAWFSNQHNVVSAQVLDDGTIEIGFHGDDEGAAALLAGAIRADLRIATFARAASDLEELFLQVTAQEPVAAGAVA